MTPINYAQTEAVEHSFPNAKTSPKSTRGGHTIDSAYLSPFKHGSQPGFRDSRSGSEPDSLIDLYGHPRSSAGKSVGDNSDKTERSDHPPMDYANIDEDEDPEKSRWIHRDKLAMIESKEMEEAGITPPPQRARAESRSKNRREPSQDQHVNGAPEHEPEVRSAKEGKKRRMQLPMRQEDQEDAVFQNFDLRTPEEIAAEPYTERPSSPMYRQQGLRSSSSRIPLPRSSPMPIPQEHIERNTPLPRKRGVSSGEEDTISYSHARSRNNSVGSQMLLDDHDYPASHPTQYASDSRPTSQGSVTRNRGPSNRTYPTQKSSITAPNSTSQKPRSTSVRSPSTPIRPRSRSGLEPRPPSAINRPEGDPPWLATMYKPDPRLPPDQQLLPTHAKRLQEEQWEKARKESEARQSQRAENGEMEGETLVEQGKGRDSSPLAVYTRSGLQAPSNLNTSRRERQMQDEDRGSGTEWPLPKTSPKPPSGLGKSSPGTDSGRVASPIASPRVKPGQDISGNGNVPGSRNTGQEKAIDPFEKERASRSEMDEEKEAKMKEKGCACCVVM